LANNDFGDYGSGISIYPSPATTKLNIQGLTTDDRAVHVYNISEKIIITSVIRENNNSTIDLTQLASGIYILKTDSGKTTRFIKK
jgi:Secretion system C-terminal sorting domain